MKQITFKGRLLLRKILTVLSFGAVAAFWSCKYGTIVEVDVVLEGTVKSADAEEPIPGISVSISNKNSLTDTDGKYRLLVNDWTTHTVLFEDIDGPENGDFQDTEVTWKSGDGPLHVVLNRNTETENDQ